MDQIYCQLMNKSQKDPIEENKQQLTGSKADGVEIVYYTDPLCCWSWAFEPQWRKLQYHFSDYLRWRYCMGGLLPSWKNFNDSMNIVNRPAQMGPIWMEASHISGMPIHNRIWIDNPPASSYLSCIAVKCAQLQSASAGEQYLRLLREAIMLHGQNISLLSVLTKIAETLAIRSPQQFNIELFNTDMQNDRGLEAFRKDIQEVKQNGINRFPTLLFRRLHFPSILITGYRPYVVILDALKQIAPDLFEVHKKMNIEAYKNHFPDSTDRELEEVLKNTN